MGRARKAKCFFFLVVPLFFYLPLAQAEVFYKGTDADGNVIFSDKPLPNGEKIEIQTPPSNTAAAQASQQTEPTSQPPLSPKPADKLSYNLSISSPVNKSTFTTDIDSINVICSIDPALQNGDMVQLQVNGQIYGQANSNGTFTLNNLPRGAYSLMAEIFSPADPSQILAKSTTVIIYQQRVRLKPAS